MPSTPQTTLGSLPPLRDTRSIPTSAHLTSNNGTLVSSVTLDGAPRSRSDTSATTASVCSARLTSTSSTSPRMASWLTSTARGPTVFWRWQHPRLLPAVGPRGPRLSAEFSTPYSTQTLQEANN